LPLLLLSIIALIAFLSLSFITPLPYFHIFSPLFSYAIHCHFRHYYAIDAFIFSWLTLPYCITPLMVISFHAEAFAAIAQPLRQLLFSMLRQIY